MSKETAETSSSSKEENTFSNVIDVDSQNHRIINSRDADITLKFFEENNQLVPEITPEQERRLSKKVMFIIVGLTAFTDLILYADKSVASYASIFEFWEDTGLTQNKYNNSNTLFYVGYIVGQANLFFVQKFPIGRVLFVIAFLWTLVIFLHCAVVNVSGVYAVRFFLGFVESCALPILNTTMAQFLTKDEKAAMAPIFYSTCMGVTIPVGFIAYGVLNIQNPSLRLWKIFMIIIGSMSFLLTTLVFFFYPNNPTDAVFLNRNEKIWVIRRVQNTTGAGIGSNVFKKYQLVEALKDPISWLFGGFFLLQQLANNLAYQQNLLFESMGNLSNLDTTLVSVASGGYQVICCIIASTALLYFKNIGALSVVFWSLPSLTGSIALAALPWGKNLEMLAMLCFASPFGIPWIISFSMASSTASGYTKKLTRNAIVMICYGIANIISPQLWQERDAPRYLPAWIVQIVLSFSVAPLLVALISYILKRRNTGRLAKIAEDSDEKDKKGFVIEEGEQIKVDLAQMDLTDLENERFIYPL